MANRYGNDLLVTRQRGLQAFTANRKNRCEMQNDAARWESIPAMTKAAAERFGDRVAVIDGDQRLTYAQLYDDARTFAAALVASGIEPGDRVSIWAPNSVEWIVAVLGLWEAGAVLVPINTRFKGTEAADLLARARVKLLV